MRGGSSWFPAVADAAWVDILTTIAVNPEKCSQLTLQSLKQSVPLFVRLLRLLKADGKLDPCSIKDRNEIENLDPKFLLISYASLDKRWLTMLGVLSVEKNEVGEALERICRYMQFACWVAFALEPDRFSEDQVNRVAFISEYNCDCYS
jgi:hypothetical protein